MTKELFFNNSRVCCVSDIHIGVHQNSAVWHDITYKWAVWLAGELKRQNICDIIICGDFFHYRDQIAVNTINFAAKILDIWSDFNIVLLVGNHDAYYKDSSDVNSLSILSGISNITVISTITGCTLFGKQVTFCPWGTKISDIPESDILFGHFEIQSFKQNSLKICSGGMSVDDIISKAKLTITGHFHLRECREYDNNTILYLGNPFEMDYGDLCDTKGYYILDMETSKFLFTENKLSPKHIKVSLSDLVKAGKLTPEIKKQFSNNFVRFIIDKQITCDDADIVVKKISSLSPLNVTIEYSSNYTKYSIDDSTIRDFSSINITGAIEEFISLMDIPNKKEATNYTLDLYRKCE